MTTHMAAFRTVTFPESLPFRRFQRKLSRSFIRSLFTFMSFSHCTHPRRFFSFLPTSVFFRGESICRKRRLVMVKATTAAARISIPSRTITSNWENLPSSHLVPFLQYMPLPLYFTLLHRLHPCFTPVIPLLGSNCPKNCSFAFHPVDRYSQSSTITTSRTVDARVTVLCWTSGVLGCLAFRLPLALSCPVPLSRWPSTH